MIGTQLAHFRITAALGAGGMGEVWRARDEKLGREVAIKLLPPELGGDEERLARLAREARLLASLNHPNVAQLYALEEVDGKHLLVMELVEGEDLGTRLARGSLPIDEALEIARQIAEGLEAAHERGIAHRDLKPGNVMVRPDGVVKVLDFGLARVQEEASSESGSLSMSPTLTAGATRAGMLLGTAAYMSPEQARGRPADRRTDIWAFGVVLWEMLTGRRHFGGETVSDVLAAVLRDEPRLEELPASAPGAVRRLVARCLTRDPRKRLQWIGEARLVLEAPDTETTESVRGSGGSSALPWLAAALGVVLGAAASWLLMDHPGPIPPARLVISALLPPAEHSFNALDGPPAMSRDGTRLAFLAARPGEPSWIFVRTLDVPTPRRIEGTEGAMAPFWSPDGRHLGFFSHGKLRTVDLEGGQPVALADAPNPTGGSWSERGQILFLPDWSQPPWVVDANGGGLRQLPEPYPGRQAPWYNWPRFLPDGDHFTFVLQDLGGEYSGLHVASISDPGSVRRLTRSISNAYWIDPGWLVLWEQGGLRGHRCARDGSSFGDEGVLLVDDVAWSSYNAYGRFSISRNGILVAQTGDSGLGDAQLVAVDRSGAKRRVVGERNEYYAPRLSRDGRRIAVDITDIQTTNGDIWVLEPDKGLRTRLSSSPLDESGPVWSPDDGEIYFGRVPDLARRDVQAARDAEVILESDRSKEPDDISRDGKTLLFSADSEESGVRDLWSLELASGAARPWLEGAYEEANGRFSPDDEWVAYQSDESGRSQISVRSFPDGDQRFVVSTEGGRIPVWRRDGGELFYYAPNGEIVSVAVTWNDGVPSFGEPVALFAARLRDPENHEFDVYPDGETFLLDELLPATDGLEMRLFQGIRKLLPE